MEGTFIERAVEDIYSEKEVAEIFADAVDRTIYNMLVHDYMEKRGISLDNVIVKAKTTMLEDYHKTALQKGTPVSAESLTRFESGLDSGALQVKDKLS